MNAIVVLLGNIWVRRAVLAVVIVAALFSVRTHYINAGRAVGAIEQGQRTAADINRQQQSDRSSAVLELAALQSRIEAAEKQAASDRQLIAVLVTQRQQIPAQVAGMTEAQVQAIINAKLGKPADAPPTYTPQDSQRIAACFKDIDLCNKQVETDKHLGEEQEKQIAAKKEQYNELASYTVGLEGKYRQLFNVTAQPVRSPRCFWLWHCSRPKAPLLDPYLVLRPKGVK